MTDAELQWPPGIRIIYIDGMIKIRRQSAVIKTIIAEAIHLGEVHLITCNAFPETGQRGDFRVSTAKRAIRGLCARLKHNRDYEEAYRRAKKDSSFVHKIGELVRHTNLLDAPLTYAFQAADRLSHHRSEIRSAANTQIAVYQLGIGTICERRVALLLKNYVFVYEGHWAMDDGKVCDD